MESIQGVLTSLIAGATDASTGAWVEVVPSLLSFDAYTTGAGSASTVTLQGSFDKTVAVDLGTMLPTVDKADGLTINCKFFYIRAKNTAPNGAVSVRMGR